MSKEMNNMDKPTRRTALKTVAYVVPTILTLSARPAKARGGSGGGGGGGDSDDSDS